MTGRAETVRQLETARARHARALALWRAADRACCGRNDQRAKDLELAARLQVRRLRDEVRLLEGAAAS